MSAVEVRATRRPPGPKGLPVVGSLLAYTRDPLRFVRKVREQHGDVALVNMAGLPFVQLSNPADIETVFVTRNHDFRKGSLGAERRLLFGQGLATSEGDFWRRQRRLAQPAFHRDRIAAYGETMVSFTEQTIAGWRDGETRNLHADMMGLTLQVVAKSLFDSDVKGDAAEVGEALEQLMKFFGRQESFYLRLLPKGLPTPGRVKFRRAVARIDRIVADIIERHRRGEADDGDLLSMLLAARDDDGSQMSDQQLRDEAITIFLAGHETTALALSWTFVLLAQHPEVESRLVAEIAALDGKRPGVEDLPRLRYTEKVIKESMRVYPPAWVLARQTMQEIEIGGYIIPRKAFVTMSQWIVHRDPRYFEDPERFLPERWDGDLEKRIPRYAYFPFGGGQRVCIGSPFAMMEAVLVLATIAQQFRFIVTRRVKPRAGISLRPKGGVWGVVSRREIGG